MDVPGEYATGNAVVERPVKTGAYFWLMLLFAIPVIGLISVIIFSFAPKKQSLKNFARANLIWVIVGLVLTLIAALVGFIVLNSAGVSLQELLSATPEQILEFLQQLFQ